MIQLNDTLFLDESEIEMTAVRAQGAGGQNVNKVSSAIHLRFDIDASSLPDSVKARLLGRSDKRVTSEGVLIIKAQNHRTQERNKAEALHRLTEWITDALYIPPKRYASRPSRASKIRRLTAKSVRSRIKSNRGSSGINSEM